MPQWNLLQPFETDDGSLDHVDAERAFGLGVEWCHFLEKLRSGRPFVDLIHDENACRIVRLAERQGRFVEHAPHITPGWVRIVVGNHCD